ncbi:endonuclease/exonuclease/phosphatase family protein [soil metagenome]
MKKSLVSCFAICLFQIAFAQKELNVMTFNIRLDLASDSLNSWQYRKDKAASEILFHEADIIGVQEALHNQMVDLQNALPGYRYTGSGREDGKDKGEYSAIFYNASRLELLSSSTFWLSETPHVPGSKSWDAAITRIVTWAKFKDKKTGKIFFHFNTHFDHMGKTARKESASMVLTAVDSLAGKSIAIITGDFNSFPSDKPIQLMMDKNNPLHLTDSKNVSLRTHYGPTGSFNGFTSKETSNDPIDYIFFNYGVNVLQHATLSESWQGRFSSDHFPVWARIILN